MKRIGKEELQELLGDSVRLIDRPGVAGVVVYQCQMLDSSSLGQTNGILFGPDEAFTCRTAEEVVRRYPQLDNQLASTIKTPSYVYYREEPATASPDG